MMRVISLVTVLFLPGTFISVSLDQAIPTSGAELTKPQTLMSTDIVSFKDQQKGLTGGVSSSGAIKLYLVLTLPLTAVTLVGWYAAYLYFNKDRKDHLKSIFARSVSPV